MCLFFSLPKGRKRTRWKSRSQRLSWQAGAVNLIVLCTDLGVQVAKCVPCWIRAPLKGVQTSGVCLSIRHILHLILDELEIWDRKRLITVRNYLDEFSLVKFTSRIIYIYVYIELCVDHKYIQRSYFQQPKKDDERKSNLCFQRKMDQDWTLCFLLMSDAE